MSRLADYFVIVGYDHEKGRSGNGCGKIIQRFPQKDLDNCPLTPGIEMFCQPSGWVLTTQRQQPTFFVSVLTDTDAERHYCACLTFHEDVMVPGSEEDTEVGNVVRAAQMYAPKSLVVVSRLDTFEAFRNCLGLIYTVYVENSQVEMATLIGNILGCIQVPPPGGPQVRFSIGAGDRQALQPAFSPTLPVTNCACAMLFKHLGISNSISVFCAALADHKVLFHSMSYTRLTEASEALTALMYPLKYSYVYVPVLPSRLLEVLCTPTPFIAGIHSSLTEDISDLLDVIIADLDGGSIKVPEHVTLSLMPEPFLSRIQHSLNLIIHPELIAADYAFPPFPPKPSHTEMLDKEIRAVFLRFFAELYFGYRSCLTIVRIHSEPVIRFHKANFLGHRNLLDDDFTMRVLDSMSFSAMVAEKGPPFRVCDIFDEVFASMQDVLRTEEESPHRLLHNIKDLATQLFTNENPNPQPYVQKIPKPTEGSYSRVHQPMFPLVDEQKVQEIIEEGLAKATLKARLTQVRTLQPRIVPIGPHITSTHDRSTLLATNVRRLEVLRNCVNFIFDNKISDARKIFPAVLKAMKSKVSRLALVDELSYHIHSNNKAMLEPLQFDLVVRLLNSALQNDSSMDENGIAAAILPLATSFCRKLSTGVIQFAYTLVQVHAVWTSTQFWEAAFYQDVEQQIRQLYLPQYEMVSDHCSPLPADTGWRSSTTPESKRRSVATGYKPREISALEIAAEQMRIWSSLSPEQQRELVQNEESTVYSQAIHYANRMVYMRVPLDAAKAARDGVLVEGESASSNVTNSVAESDSFDAESGFDEQEVQDMGANVVKFVTRFVDKVCSECGVTSDHIKALHQMIPGVVAMHIETLEAVHQESKRLPPIQKPKILAPTLLPGEEVVMDGLRAYLVPDGREEGVGGSQGGPTLLPAEGALFLTTYRIIFKGTPCDLLACEQIICRAFPIATLTREKKINVQYFAQEEQALIRWMQDGLQLRSNTFQLLRIAFDEEVNPDDVETLRKLIMKVRYPSSVMHTYAFTGYLLAQPTQYSKGKEKHASLKGYAKRTLLKTAKKVGFKTKEVSTKQPKMLVPTPPLARRGLPGHPPPKAPDAIPIAVSMGRDRPGSVAYEDKLSVIDETELSAAIQNDAKNVDRLAERPYCRDYARLGLGSLGGSQPRNREPFRLSLVNTSYAVCRSYPAVLVVPQSVSDDSIRKFARSHRQYRFPVVTWRHQRTKAVLLRASGFHGKGVMEMLKGKPNTPVTSGTEILSTSMEQEKYFSALVSATPLDGSTATAPLLGTPRMTRKDTSSSTSSFSRAFGSFRSSFRRDNPPQSPTKRASVAPSSSLGRMSSLKDRPRPTSAMASYSSSTLVPGNGGTSTNHKQNGSIDLSDFAEAGAAQGLHRAALYVFGEKAQVKGIKIESFPKCDFIPVDYHEVRHIKSSFKKLSRACVPSVTTASDKGFLRAVEESEWLPQLQNILQIAGAVVDLLDVQGSSVMLCLEDGWDFTTQVSAVAQLLLDPYYRTFEGFRVLIEKEWLSFGHRFTHRSNQTAANQASGFAPILLQFFDVVHQIHRQFPLSFEFNQYYLKFLAFHSVSGRFRTFMLDNEYERVEAGWLLEERQRHLSASSIDLGADCDVSPTHSGVGGGRGGGLLLWDYVDMYSRTSPVFCNFMYSPIDQDTVLRPYSNISNLCIWEYFTQEDLAYGPSFDFEIFANEAKLDEETENTQEGSVRSMRKIINACYDNVEKMLPDACTYLLSEVSKRQQDVCSSPESWASLWDRLVSPTRETLTRQVSFNTQIVRSHGRSLHKRSTIELLVKGKMLGDAARIFSQAHRFEKFTYTTPASCDYCSHVLWGLVKTGMRCSDCNYNCHDKCVPHAPKNCTRLQPLTETRTSTSSVSKASLVETASIAEETSSHEGYLYKRGARLKGWKKRWFVLDSMKHQLRYYDTQDDTNCSGFIDLGEVEAVQALGNVQGAPKKADDKAFFELKTSRRVYNFLAPESKSAIDWIGRVQNCIQ